MLSISRKGFLFSNLYFSDYLEIQYRKYYKLISEWRLKSIKEDCLTHLTLSLEQNSQCSDRYLGDFSSLSRETRLREFCKSV